MINPRRTHQETMMDSHKPTHPTWMKDLLLIAGCYNLAWGMGIMVFPVLSLEILGYPTTGAGPMFWQGTGMLVGLFGLGYAMAAFNPVQHWLMIFIGFLSKLLAGAGCIVGALSGTMPAVAGWLAIPNDLIWWIPFALILRHIWRVHSRPEEAL